MQSYVKAVFDVPYFSGNEAHHVECAFWVSKAWPVIRRREVD